MNVRIIRIIKGLFKTMQTKLFLIPVISFFIASTLFAESTVDKKNQLQKNISTASNVLKKSQETSNKLRKKVRAAEDKLHEISKQLHNTESKINRLTSKLTNSNIQRVKLDRETNQQKKALAQQMQALYTSGKQSHLRLLLKQDDPSDISRTIKYFEYLNQHRLKKIKLINKRLYKIKEVQAQINKDSVLLKSLQKKQHTKKTSLKSAVQKKEKSLKKQYAIVISDKQKLKKLKKDEARLNNILLRLDSKRKKEDKEQQAKKQANLIKKQAKINKDKKDKAQKKSIAKKYYVPNKPFSALKGRLSWPVKGKMLHKYGSIKNSKQKWKAAVIAAPGGTNVHAIARGKIEFSGRVNGYGYLVIIRHDNNYRSLYGYNRSVYKKAGQIVKAGEVIAAVGNSGRIKQTGLLFQIAKRAVQKNPAIWCR